MSDQIEREQQIEEESLTKNSLQIQKAAWIREELEKRRAQEDQLLQQILREQQMLQELDEDMDQNMAHAKEGRRYREDMKARVDDRVYEMHDLSADKREGMRNTAMRTAGLCTGNGFLFAGVVCVCRVSAWHRFPDMPCTYVFYRSTGSHSGT